jgi:hypothetical protein
MRGKIKRRKTKTGKNWKWREKRGKKRNIRKHGKMVGANKKSEELCDLTKGMRIRVRMIRYFPVLRIRIRIH